MELNCYEVGDRSECMENRFHSCGVCDSDVCCTASGMWCGIVWLVSLILGGSDAYIFSAEDGNSRFLRNYGACVPN
jgi:hypothetical protein